MGADLVIVTSDTIADKMAADYQIERPTVVLSASIAAPLEALEPHDHAEPLEILYHGILVPGRGIEIAIDALALCAANVELVVRGPGPLRKTLEAHAEAAGVGNRCRIEDGVAMEDLVAAAAQSDVGLMPFEQRIGYDVVVPNKMFEYLAAGLAVVSSDFPELRRVIAGHDLGVLVKPGDPEALARAFDGLAGDRDLVDEMRRRSLATAASYTWTAHEHVLLDAYAPILAGSNT